MSRKVPFRHRVWRFAWYRWVAAVRAGRPRLVTFWGRIADRAWGTMTGQFAADHAEDMRDPEYAHAYQVAVFNLAHPSASDEQARES